MSFFDDVVDAVDSAGSAVGDAVESAVDTVADAVDEAVDAAGDAVQDAVDDVVDFVCNASDILCVVANIVGGIINGIVQVIKEIVHAAATVVKDLGHIIGSIFRLDFPGLINALGSLVIDVAGLFIIVGRAVIGGYFVGGVVKQFERRALRNFVEDLLREKFSDPSVLAEIRAKLRLDDIDWGLTIEAEHKVFMLDSAHVELWRWHKEGFIDLYALAGLLSFSSFQIQRPRTWVRSCRRRWERQRLSD